MNSLEYKHVFFDLDKTLWDFKSNSREAISELHASHLDKYQIDLNNFIDKYESVNDYYWDLYRRGKLKKSILRKIRFEKALEAFGVDNKELASQNRRGVPQNFSL